MNHAALDDCVPEAQIRTARPTDETTAFPCTPDRRIGGPMACRPPGRSCPMLSVANVRARVPATASSRAYRVPPADR